MPAPEMPGEAISVTSAYPLPQASREKIMAALSAFTGRPVEAVFGESPELVCGLRAEIGPWRLEANLAGELESFRRAAKNGE